MSRDGMNYEELMGERITALDLELTRNKLALCEHLLATRDRTIERMAEERATMERVIRRTAHISYIFGAWENQKKDKEDKSCTTVEQIDAVAETCTEMQAYDSLIDIIIARAKKEAGSQ